MRIAVFHNAPNQSGARTALAHLLRELHREHRIDLYSCLPISETMVPIRDAVDAVNIVPVRLMPHVRYRSCLLTRLRSLVGSVWNLNQMRAVSKRIARQIDSAGYDVLLSDICHVTMAADVLYHTRTPAVFLCQNPMRRAREPVAFFMGPRPALRSWVDACYDKSCRVVEAVEKWVLRRREVRNARAAGLIMCNSLYSREAIYHAYGLMARPFRLGVDRERFRCLDIPQRSGVISVGGLQFNKGYHLILDALALCPAESRMPLTLVANRAEPAVVQQLSKHAARVGVEVIIRSNVSNEELVVLYNQSLVTVFVPLMEPFGLVTIESMACGTPVIAADQGGPREVLRHGETGLLVDRSPAAIAASIKRLQQDAALRTSISAAAREEVDARWSWRQAAQQLEAGLLTQALSPHSSQAAVTGGCNHNRR